MAEAQEDKPPEKKPLPLYAQYLSHPDTPYDCWFDVGNPDKTKPEKIGGSKLNLMAHSELFRRMLHESPLAEKGPITVLDIEPATFKLLLRFIHGYFEVKDLSFEEAVALLCAAEKYFVHDLRKRLGDHITSLLTVNNVFLPLTKLECWQEETLKRAIEKIVQQETKQLVAKDEFLELNTVGILNIVTQECLQVTEVELWKAVVSWAKHQAGSEKAEHLREHLTKTLIYIRFCTMSDTEFNKEVALTGILTDSEIASVAKILGGASVLKTLGENPNISGLTTLCYKLNIRDLFFIKEFDIDFQFAIGDNDVGRSSSRAFYLTTDEKAVRLLSAEVPKVESSSVNIYRCAPKKLRFKCECKVYLTRITNYCNNQSSERQIHFSFVKEVKLDSKFEIPFPEEMTLQPLNKYKLELHFNHQMIYLTSKERNHILSNKGLLVSGDNNDFLYSPMSSLTYKVI